MKKTNIVYAFAVLAAASFPACQEAAPDTSLRDPSGRHEQREESAALRQLRLRQNVRVVISGETWTVATDPETESSGDILSQEQFHDDVVLAHCDSLAFTRTLEGDGEWSGEHVTCPDDNTKTCGNISCRLERATCIAHTYSEIANAVAPITLNARFAPAESTTATLPPQDLAARALLMEIALQRFHEASLLVEGAVPSGQGSEPPLASVANTPECLADFAEGVTHVEAISFMVGDHANLVDELAYGAMDAYVRLADSSAGSISDPVLASQTRWELRQHAASLVVGFDANDSGASPGNPFCDRASWSPSTLAAVEVIRHSGVDPARLIAIPGQSETPISLQDFLFDGADSVLTRYYLATTGLEHFPSPNVVNLPTPSEFLAEVGLTDDDFAAARAALQQEIRAFRRPLDVALSGVTLPTPPTTTEGDGYEIDPRIFAATREEPSLQSWIAYANGTGFHYLTGDPIDPAEIYADPVIVSLRHTVISLMGSLVPAVGDDYGEPFEPLLSAVQAARAVGMADFQGAVGVWDRELPGNTFAR